MAVITRLKSAITRKKGVASTEAGKRALQWVLDKIKEIEKDELEKEVKNTDFNPAIKEIVDFYNEITKQYVPNAKDRKANAPTKKAIIKRLKDDFSVSNFKRCIVDLYADDFYKRREYKDLTLEYLTREKAVGKFKNLEYEEKREEPKVSKMVMTKREKEVIMHLGRGDSGRRQLIDFKGYTEEEIKEVERKFKRK